MLIEFHKMIQIILADSPGRVSLMVNWSVTDMYNMKKARSKQKSLRHSETTDQSDFAIIIKALQTSMPFIRQLVQSVTLQIYLVWTLSGHIVIYITVQAPRNLYDLVLVIVTYPTSIIEQILHITNIRTTSILKTYLPIV